MQEPEQKPAQDSARKPKWSPGDFRRYVDAYGVSIGELHRTLAATLEDPPSLGTVYSWAHKRSRGPSRGAWKKAVAQALRCRLSALHVHRKGESQTR